MKIYLPKNLDSRKGFTLIELLVVVAILAILAVIGAVIFSGVQSRGRDGRRTADIIAISRAFEANKVTGSTVYPAAAATWFAGATFPADTYTGVTPPQYSIAYVVSTPSCVVGLAPQASRVWATTSANPGSASFTLTPALCGTLLIGNASAAPINISSFQICALLENGTAPSFFCYANAQ